MYMCVRKAWIWANRGFLVFPDNLRVRVRVKVRVRYAWFVLAMVCTGNPWIVLGNPWIVQICACLQHIQVTVHVLLPCGHSVRLHGSSSSDEPRHNRPGYLFLSKLQFLVRRLIPTAPQV